MPVIVNQISSAPGTDEKSIIETARKKLGISPASIRGAHIYKTSLDARKRENIHYVHSVIFTLNSTDEEIRISDRDALFTYAAPAEFRPVISNDHADGRVVIAGFGPAGMFCALALAEQGYRPLVLERGESMDERVASVERFMGTGILNEKSNIQFGEGGAGTFSDGKLTTRIKDPLCRYVLERMTAFGAPEEILTKAKPHIGTDKLRGVVKGIRERIIELGGEIRFCTQLEDIELDGRHARAVSFTGGKEEVSAVVLAIGHSARDTFEMLHRKGIFLEAKPFSVGARIEHRQTEVDRSLYGEYAGSPMLPKGEYQLSYREGSGRAAYTFCMCPGGTVVPAASETGGTVTNGMSVFARDGVYANSALVVSVSPEDFGSKPLDGMYFAREIEQKAYKAAGSYKACASSVKGFLAGKADLDTDIEPSYSLGVTAVDYEKIFPKQVTEMMRTGLKVFSRKMKCFGDGKALLCAPETRTSSPVRITRDKDRMTSLSCDNLYPCGEGAGYAGGIMSAAVDGLNTALKIMAEIAP
ncbi:NAD(P)/FAD-dependent oxidoreductase [Ruminococcus albus]|uniref:Fumarate reductase/succinate dehydrogenase flavoprotein domain protein n=1 Tax=Ruminococcus albus (strain ATCC 27210 / DSM 20455 / JCM 14654 / NCDO 2250 / 7) TaxID=697329 RepID=E6UDE4_RUMA7|nr:NAD(P)/FAD-dependent oxidoreductase [Ruminococcus albus]ADU22827.1 fumarate reductase/succinate dehydrogenase flavoprotein domain protein [Ruminococcus albus 7 = DSM 20455]